LDKSCGDPYKFWVTVDSPFEWWVTVMVSLYVMRPSALLQDRPEPGDKAFAPRLLAITTFPHQQPKGNPEAWTRRNGRALLTVRPGWDAKAGKRLPY